MDKGQYEDPLQIYDLMLWQLWIIKNYEYCEGTLIQRDVIIKHALNEKENVGEIQSLTGYTLTRIVNKVWTKEKVSLVKKGGRSKRIFFYLNLRRKQAADSLSQSPEKNPIHHLVDVMKVPSLWRKVQDRVNSVDFLFCTKLEFAGRRLIVEICCESDENQEIDVTLKCGKSKVQPSEVAASFLPADSAEKIYALMTFVEVSTLCRGFKVNDGVATSLPVTKGTIKDLTTGLAEERAFSEKCLIFSPAGGICSSCRRISIVDHQRKKRKLANPFPSAFCNNKWLTSEELIEKHKAERARRVNAKDRERYWRHNFEEHLIEMEEADHSDLDAMMSSISSKDIPDEIQLMWEQQQKILNSKSSNGYRWHPKIIRLCLDLYCKNPHVLDSLRKFVYLPSQRTLRLNKSKVEQKPGWNHQLLQWCFDEATKNGLQEQDYYGGLVFDEMKIQENLEMSHSDGKHRLIGFVDLGEKHNHMTTLAGNKDSQCQLAQQVLQFIFLSDCGFRFPVAQFPSRDCTPSDLYFLFWEGVRKMAEYGFSVYWCILDGAELNRQFIKLHFIGKDPASEGFVTSNIITGDPMVFIVDCKHNFKKIRNNLEKSNTHSKPRCLVVDGKKILWSHLEEAFNWDQKTNTLPIHEKLTYLHFHLDPSSKMRNSLAEDVLNNKMLYLLQAYKREMSKQGKDGTALDSTLALVKHTSSAINFFSDKWSISSTQDPRLKELEDFYRFFLAWHDKKSSDKHFISSKLWFDLQSMCKGFVSVVKIKLALFPCSMVKPAIINQDCAENHFCQVRACNGQNNHPTYKLQESCQNSIIYGQTTISRKSNAGNQSTQAYNCASLPQSKKKC